MWLISKIFPYPALLLNICRSLPTYLFNISSLIALWLLVSLCVCAVHHFLSSVRGIWIGNVVRKSTLIYYLKILGTFQTLKFNGWIQINVSVELFSYAFLICLTLYSVPPVSLIKSYFVSGGLIFYSLS
jgi:hypothetical protein